MRTVISIRLAALPGERTVVTPEERGVVASRRIRRDDLLPREHLENVSRVVDRKRVMPEEHPACCAVAGEVQPKIRAGSGNGDRRPRETTEPKKDQRSKQEEALPSRTARLFCHSPSTQVVSRGLLTESGVSGQSRKP